jgi:GNAT superfamily N-acetyltransferase
MPASREITAPALLTPLHIVDNFDCGQPVLNQWLAKHALQNLRADAARTFVVCLKNHVIGYYSLAVGAVDHATATPRTRKGLAKHPIPVMVLARLAVHRNQQGIGIDTGLLKDAVSRTLQASDFAGIRAMFVHAKDDSARRFYSQYGFEPSPVDPLKLMLLIKDARKAFGPIGL